MAIETEQVSVSELNRKASGQFSADSEERVQLLREAAVTLSGYVTERAEAYSDVGLSDQEAMVAVYRDLGFTNRAIALMMDLSPSTVGEYTDRIRTKHDEARALVDLLGGSRAVERFVVCPRCGHRNQRSQADAEFEFDRATDHRGGTLKTERESLTFRCYECWEEWTERRSVERRQIP